MTIGIVFTIGIVSLQYRDSKIFTIAQAYLVECSVTNTVKKEGYKMVFPVAY